MKLPRDLDAPQLIKALAAFGYKTVRQTGSHIRLQCDLPSPHAITIPYHSPLKIGMLAAILADIAEHQRMSRDELLKQLF